MGLLVDGIWQNDWYDTTSTGGEFIRKDAQFRHWIGDPDFAADAGRYHLFVSLACPWAHRTLIFRKLKNLSKLLASPSLTPECWSTAGCFRRSLKITQTKVLTS